MFKVFTLNVSAGNLSAWAPAGFSLLSKYEAIVELIKHHSPQLISLQELDSQAAKYFIAALGSAADAGWQHLTQAESHCHSTHIWAAASLQAKPKRSVGPVAIAQIQLTGDDGCFYFAGEAPPGAGCSRGRRILVELCQPTAASTSSPLQAATWSRMRRARASGCSRSPRRCAACRRAAASCWPAIATCATRRTAAVRLAAARQLPQHSCLPAPLRAAASLQAPAVVGLLPPLHPTTAA